MRHWTMLLAAILAVACQPANSDPTLGQPPPGSYDARAWSLRVGDDVVSVQGAVVTPAFFREAKLHPLLGRVFGDGEYGASGTRVAMLSHDLWAGRFDSAPEIIGRLIELDGSPTTVVGIMPRGFAVPENAQIWMPQ
jgi:hypothetical protein